MRDVVSSCLVGRTVLSCVVVLLLCVYTPYIYARVGGFFCIKFAHVSFSCYQLNALAK